MSTHNKAKVFFISLSMATFVVMVVMNGAAGSGAFKGIFQRTVGNISNKYNTDLTPAGWTFLIWNVIYLWQLAWLGYALSGICRRNELGWFYMKPNVLPTPFYLVWILNNALNVGWLFLWDKEFLSPALLVLTGLTSSNCVILFLACQGLHSHRTWLQNHRRTDLWLLRILVQNGIALYATWTTVATLLNFAVVLIYTVGMADQTSTTVVLSVLLVLLVLWFYLENFLLDKYVHYILTVYPVVMVALFGNIAQHYNTSAPSTNNIFAVVLMVAASVMFLVRLGLVTCRHRYTSLPTSRASKDRKEPQRC
ncbi:uncharacterized protein LOC122742932 [Dromiciops gliroides]|uniref:uncharacterized protein LOC122742932 n=1 Tax=Dromiciops gliroides TaxID=33562 RepID=UPI001CC3D236|nr:uncharacterized protein LOC122742932 [Dromiciops gliroides]